MITSPVLRGTVCRFVRGATLGGVRRCGVRGAGDEELELLVVAARHDTLTRELVTACDREGIRIVPVGDGETPARLAQAFGLGVPMSPRASGRELVRALRDPLPVAPVPRNRRRVIAVWGAAGSPGRSTIAIELAVELARDRDVALIDADSHAPSTCPMKVRGSPPHADR